MDLGRVIAMVLVVLDHAVINVRVLADQDTGDVRWWIAQFLLAISRLAVPVFIMISGALLLDPARTEPLGTFARRRLQRVAVPLLVWSVAYLTFYRDVLDQPLTDEDALRRLVAGDPYYHLYYLYIALGLYALTPFLRRLIAAADRQMVVALCGLAFALGITDQFLQWVLQVGANNGLTYFVDYVGFYLAGWLLRDAARNRRLMRAAAPGLALAIALVVLASWALIEAGQGVQWFYPHSYLSPLVIVASIGLYVTLQTSRSSGRGAGRLRRLSDLSLGTYLVHPMLLDLYREDRTMPAGVDGFLGWVLGLTLLGVLAGLTITSVARLVPVLRRVF